MRNTSEIIPGDLYRFAAIEKQFGISDTTLWRWRESKRLRVIPTLRSCCYGRDLIEAIMNIHDGTSGKT